MAGPQCSECGKFYKLQDDRGFHAGADCMGEAIDEWICEKCYEKNHRQCRTCGTTDNLIDYDGDSYICKPCCQADIDINGEGE